MYDYGLFFLCDDYFFRVDSGTDASGSARIVVCRCATSYVRACIVKTDRAIPAAPWIWYATCCISHVSYAYVYTPRHERNVGHACRAFSRPRALPQARYVIHRTLSVTGPGSSRRGGRASSDDTASTQTPTLKPSLHVVRTLALPASHLDGGVHTAYMQTDRHCERR